MKRVISTLLVFFACLGACAAPSLAQAAQVPPAAQAPAAQQPAFPDKAPGAPAAPAPGSPTVMTAMELRFHPDNSPMVDTSTYLYYIKTRPVLNDQWQPYNEAELLA